LRVTTDFLRFQASRGIWIIAKIFVPEWIQISWLQMS
jgi:hypothetical protein